MAKQQRSPAAQRRAPAVAESPAESMRQRRLAYAARRVATSDNCAAASIASQDHYSIWRLSLFDGQSRSLEAPDGAISLLLPQS